MQLTLYMRSYCSLCETMRQELLPYRQRLGFELVEIDIDTDPRLEQAYGELVPVLVAPTGEICHYFLDHEALQHCFAGS